MFQTYLVSQKKYENSDDQKDKINKEYAEYKVQLSKGDMYEKEKKMPKNKYKKKKKNVDNIFVAERVSKRDKTIQSTVDSFLRSQGKLKYVENVSEGFGEISEEKYSGNLLSSIYGVFESRLKKKEESLYVDHLDKFGCIFLYISYKIHLTII